MVEPEEDRTLVVVLDDGQEIRVDGPVVLGRNPVPPAAYPQARPVQVQDASMRMSKTHLVLVPSGSGVGFVDVGATNGLVTLPFVVEGLAMGLISGVLTAAISLGGYSYMVQASDGLGGVWEMIMGQALVPVSAVWSTIIPYSLIGGAVVGGLGSMFSIRKHLNV